MSTRTIFAAAVMVFFWPGLPLALAAETLTSDGARRVADYVTGEMDSLGIPGAAVVIVEGRELSFAEGFGIAGANREHVTPQTPFHLASISKSLTALAVMQLVDAGDLELSDRLGDLLPGLIPAGAEAGSITVENLLGHTSGWTERDGLVNRVENDLSPRALESNTQRILATPLDHGIGEFEYSNANYDVLGYLVESLSGMPFPAYMEREVFAPLDMTHSFASEAAAIEGGVADGHYPFFGSVRPHRMEFVPGSLPSAYLTASAEDLGHFLVAQLNEGRYLDKRVLSPEGTAALQRPLTSPNPWEGYAMGMRLYPLWSAGRLSLTDIPQYEVPLILEHDGSSESYASAVLMIPEEKVGVVVLLNLNDESVPSLYHQMHFGIANILLGLEPPPTQAYEGALERYAKGFVLIAVTLFLVRIVISFFKLRRMRESPGKRSMVRQLLLPLLIDLVLVGSLWWLLANQAGVPLTLVRQSVPDIFSGAVVASVLGLSWALTRTFVVARSR